MAPVLMAQVPEEVKVKLQETARQDSCISGLWSSML